MASSTTRLGMRTFDVDASTVIYEKNADNIRPVASLTKLVSSLALMASDYDLDAALNWHPGSLNMPGKDRAVGVRDLTFRWDLPGRYLGAREASRSALAFR